MGKAKLDWFVDEQGHPLEFEVEAYEEDYKAFDAAFDRGDFALIQAKRAFIETVLARVKGGKQTKTKFTVAERSAAFRTLYIAGMTPPGAPLPFGGASSSSSPSTTGPAPSSG